jgi:hypothetical protein
LVQRAWRLGASVTRFIQLSVPPLSRVAVGLGWTRARASNPRFGQGWMHPFCPRGLDGLGFLSGRVGRVRVLVRRVESDTDFYPLGRPTRDCCMSRNSDWVFNPRIERSFEISGWVRTCRSVRARTLS